MEMNYTIKRAVISYLIIGVVCCVFYTIIKCFRIMLREDSVL